MNFLLSWNPLVVVLLVSFSFSLLVVLIYKFFTDQEKMKELKEGVKEMQKKFKEMQKELKNEDSDVTQDDLMGLQKNMMSKNLKYSGHSMKISLFTIIPVMILFSFMNAHFVYENIGPNSNFEMSVYMNENISLDVVSELNYQLISSGKENELFKKVYSFDTQSKGIYVVDFKTHNSTFSKEILVSDLQEYTKETKTYDDGVVEKISINYDKLTPLGENISLFGWNPGWLGVYIIFSIIFNMLLRKLLNVY